MPRNRVIYQSEALYIAPTGLTNASNASDTSLRRIQSCNYNFSVDRQDINQYGELNGIDRLIINEPTVTSDISYYFEPIGFNESHMGFRVDASTGTDSEAKHMLDHIIRDPDGTGVKNLFIVTADPGVDANDTGKMAIPTNYDGIIGLGNATVTSWSLEASVGSIPTVSCSFEAQNILFTGGITAPTIRNPALKDGSPVTDSPLVTLPSGAGEFNSTNEVSAVRPGDITFVMTPDAGTTDTDVDTPALGLDESDLKIQSVSVSMQISREPIRKLGKLFAFAREISFPITCSMSVNALVGDLDSKSLHSLLANCGDDKKYTCYLKLIGQQGACVYKTSYISLKGAKLDSQNITSSIGPNKSVSLELSAQIGKNSGLHFTNSSTTP
ncbi:hypothetical protein OAE97_00160 [Verrucomicrobia bacterium]|nr:hypothetical protein [Verrucomicrobiota bacterium]